MKILLYFLSTLCCLPVIGYGQKCVIANSKENVLYVGLANSLDVAVNGYKCKDFRLTTDNGKLETTGNVCSYVIVPEQQGMATISVISKKTKKVIGVVKINVKGIPSPVAMIDRRGGGLIGKNVFKAQLGLTADILNMDIEARVIVTGFNMTLFRNNQVFLSKYCESSRFNDEIKAALNEIEVGDKIVFSNITYKAIDKNGLIQPIEFTISE
ncbi:MAG: GldM family protein [Chitinophagales bacterium]|nr:GldM family protein [Chitinophagales bacterium]